MFISIYKTEYPNLSSAIDATVAATVESASDYCAGQLERMQSKLEALLKVVGTIADNLPPDVQSDIANALGYRCG